MSPDRRGFRFVLSSSLLPLTPELETKQTSTSQSPNAESTDNYNEYLSAHAFNLGLTTDELRDLILKDQEHYKRVLDIVSKSYSTHALSWAEAENLLARQQARGDKLLDKTSRYHNSRQPKAAYPKEPKPPRIFKNSYKARKKPSKEQLAKQMAAYTKWKAIIDAVNNSDLDRHD